MENRLHNSGPPALIRSKSLKGIENPVLPSDSSWPLKAPFMPGLINQHLWKTTSDGDGMKEEMSPAPDGLNTQGRDSHICKWLPWINAWHWHTESDVATKRGVVKLRLRGLEKACPEKGSGAPALEDEKEPPNREKEKGLHIQSSRYRGLWKLWTWRENLVS